MSEEALFSEPAEPACTCQLGERDPLCPWHSWFDATEIGGDEQEPPEEN